MSVAQAVTLPPSNAVGDREGEGVMVPLILPPPPHPLPSSHPLPLLPPLIAQGVCVAEPPEGEVDWVAKKGGEGECEPELEVHTEAEVVWHAVGEREGESVDVGDSVLQAVAVALVQ